MAQRLADLFSPQPEQWGLHGDPYLWNELAQHLADTDMPPEASLPALLENAISELTGAAFDGNDGFCMTKYDGGGGMISRHFWRKTAIPLLVSRVKARAPRTHDYFAELYVAGMFGDHGWSVYFPKRDVGFDFVVSKEVGGQVILRPVQVKGLYPTVGKLDKTTYGFRGKLSALHKDLVLAIPFFSTSGRGVAPSCIAYMPVPAKAKQGEEIKCMPGRLIDGLSQPRPSFIKYFDQAGIVALENLAWSPLV